MESLSAEYPSLDQLYRGAILLTIGQALFIAHSPILLNETYWDGLNYMRNNNQGAYGVVYFGEEVKLGGFFDVHSPRNPYRSNEDYDIAVYLEGMPSELLPIFKGQILERMLNDYKGTVTPVISAAFWSIDGKLTARESWKDLYANGADLLRIETIDNLDEAIAQCEEEVV